MKVLVTGAAGFLGRHICKSLNNAGHTVIGLDVSGPPREVFSTRADICNEWINADITKVLPLMKLDAIVHLAAMAAPNLCAANPSLAFDVNAQGTSQVLRLALESGAKKFVFSSSAHVYDIPPRYFPTDEVHPLRLNNTYTTTKLLGEQLCQLYFENHSLSFTTLRLFNVYGPGQQLGYLVPDLIAKAKHGRIELQGSDITKDWVFVSDVADAFVKALSSDFVGPINVGTGIETGLGTIAQIIAGAYEVELDCHPAAIPSRMQCDRRRAERILGWCPTVDLEHGIRNTIDVAVRTMAKMSHSEVAIHTEDAKASGEVVVFEPLIEGVSR